MGEPLLRVMMLIGLTHGVRAACRLAGPRIGPLALGLPTTTALWLIGCSLERGPGDAGAGAESCLIGLVAASALPLAFARAVGGGLRADAAAALAVASYLVVATGCAVLAPRGAFGPVAFAAAGVLLASVLSRRIDLPSTQAEAVGVPSHGKMLWIRTAVPAACLSAVTAARELAGSEWAGLLSPFPGASLAILVVTHLESGAAAAGRMARSLPAANFGMVAFLAIFRLGCPALGLGPGTAVGYAAALATLAVVGWCSQTHPVRSRMGRRADAGSTLRPDSGRSRRPRPALSFSPRFDLAAW